jgi:hypothetical protein
LNGRCNRLALIANVLDLRREGDTEAAAGRHSGDTATEHDEHQTHDRRSYPGDYVPHRAVGVVSGEEIAPPIG